MGTDFHSPQQIEKGRNRLQILWFAFKAKQKCHCVICYFGFLFFCSLLTETYPTFWNALNHCGSNFWTVFWIWYYFFTSNPLKKLIIWCIFHIYLLQKYFICCMLGGGNPDIGVIDIKYTTDTINLLNIIHDIFIIHILFFSQKKQPNLTRTVENIQINEEDNEIRYFIC